MSLLCFKIKSNLKAAVEIDLEYEMSNNSEIRNTRSMRMQ